MPTGDHGKAAGSKTMLESHHGKAQKFISLNVFAYGRSN
jgi:hypothetical protein